MNIIVCIKQVPDTHDVKINPETNTLIREGVESIINPFDENAMEAALQLREKHGGKVTVISMGPPQVESALKECVARGVDEVFLISDRAFAGADTWATSETLAAAVKKIDQFDLILFGKQAIDGDTAQVGPGVAELLGLPLITYVKKIEFIAGKFNVERTFEDGYEIMESTAPAVLTVVKEINEPRLPSLKGKMRAKKIEIPIWGLKDLNIEEKRVGLKGSATQVVKIFTPPPREDSQQIEGTPEEISVKLAAILKKQTLC